MKDMQMYPKGRGIGFLLKPNYITRKPIYEFLKQNYCLMTGTVLDYGAGKAPYKSIFTKCDKYIALDYSESAELYGYKNGETIYYDGKVIPLEDETVDNAVSIEVLEHIEDLENSLNEIRRVLKCGGILLFTVPMVQPLHGEPYDFRRFTKYGIEKMLKEKGFEMISICGSTRMKDTIKRLKIMNTRYKFQKIVTVWNNLLYISHMITGKYLHAIECRFKKIRGKRCWLYDYENLYFPVDYMVVCRKCQGI